MFQLIPLYIQLFHFLNKFDPMSMHNQLFASSSVVSLSKLINEDLPSQKAKNVQLKKIFTRKPSYNFNVTSKAIVNRQKTESTQSSHEQKNTLNEKQKRGKIREKEAIKFISKKNSQSLEKLSMSSSMGDLSRTNAYCHQPKNFDFGFKNNINFRNHHRNQTFKENDDNLRKISKVKFDQLKQELTQSSNHEQSTIYSKYNIGETQLSSNQNILISQQFKKDDDQQTDQFSSITDETFSPSHKKKSMTQCPACSDRLRKIVELQRNYNIIEKLLNQKSSEIKMLNQKIIALQKNLQMTKNLKINLQSEIKIIKQNGKIFESQKQQIQMINHKLQSEVKKLSQELKYKDLQLTISKIYKTKSLEMEFKVETLKRELERSKLAKKRQEQSRSMKSLSMYSMKKDSSNLSIEIPPLQFGKKKKKVNLKKVYQEDNVLLSLTSESAIESS